MPIFNLELRFDDNGSLKAVRSMDSISASASNASQAVDKVGESSARSAREVQEFGRDSVKAVDAISGKMKSLVKDVIALAAAYGSVKSAMSFMNRGLQLNSSMEQSQIGIASLITSMVKIQDEQGKILEGEDKYHAAQKMSAELMKEIQILGLETTATSESLVEGVQSIMGPALQAGMALKDIPKFAVQGAQAMQTLGIPLNQMRTELEALLSGNINKSQDILAPKLFADVKGDLKEYIKGLRDSGKLIEEIMARLKPFELAGKDVSQTWTALTSNLSEAIDVLAGQSANKLTDSLKQSVNLLNELMISQGTGELGIGKDFKNIANVLTDIEGKIGGTLLSATEKVVELVKEFNDYLGSNEAVQHFEYLTTAIKALSAALIGFAASRTVSFGREKWAEISGAVTKYRAEIINTARSQVAAATAAKTQQQVFMQTARAQAAAASNSAIRQQQIARETLLINQETAAQQRLNAALSMSTGRAAFSKGLTGLASMMGGPLSIAITGLVAGLSFLKLGEDEAASATERHAQAQDVYQKVIQGSIDETGKLIKVLDDAQLAEARAAQRQLSRDWTSALRSVRDQIEDVEQKINAELRQKQQINVELELVGVEELPLDDFIIKQEAIDSVKKYFNEFKNEKITFDVLQTRLDEIQRRVSDIDVSGIITGIIDQIIQDSKIEELNKALSETNEVIKKSEEAHKGNATAVEQQSEAYKSAITALDDYNNANSTSIDNEKSAIEWLTKRYNATEAGTKSLEENARAKDANAIKTLELGLAELETAARAAVATAMLDGATDAQIKQANELSEKVVQMRSLIQSFKDAQENFGSKKGVRKTSGNSHTKSASIDNAAEKWKELNQQLAKLQGRATSSAAGLGKTLKSIEDTGKAAKKSAGEIESLKQAFIEASDIKTVRELNKELLQLEGNAAALSRMENEDKLSAFKTRLSEVKSLSKDEKDILLGRYQVAVQTSVAKDNLDVRVSFYKDLAQLSGDYGQSIEYQNRLIDEQARAWMAAGIAVDDVNRRVSLMKQELSRDPLAGITRGMIRFGDEATNMAKSMEDMITNAFSGMEDAFVNFTKTGKLSFSDLADSIISDLMRIAVKSAITGPLAQGLGSMFGSFFGGGSANYSAGQTATMQANGMQWSGGNSGWLTGVHGHHGGGIAGRDYSFKRDMPLSAFINAPRFHSGGGFFEPNEYPAILLRGERVLNPTETREYNSTQSSLASGYLEIMRTLHDIRQNESTSRAGVQVNVYNNSDATVEERQTTDSNGQVDITLLIEKTVGDAMRRPGSAPYNALQNTWQGNAALASR